MKFITLFLFLIVSWSRAFALSSTKFLLFARGSVTNTATNNSKKNSTTLLKESNDDGDGVDKEDDGKASSSFSMPDVSSWTSMQVDFSNFDIDTVVTNVLQSDKPLGQRGELYFIAQAALILCILLGGVPVIGDSLKVLLGPSCLLGGIAIAALGLVDLGSDSLSPFPATTETSTLKTLGIYKEMRHPIYSGLLLFSFGLTILTNSADRLILTVALAYLLEVKSNKEEEYLMESFSEDYEKYKVS